MPASFRNLVLAFVTASATVAMVPSCADNEETIFIRQVQALRAPECTVTPDPQALAASSGVLDLAQGVEYTVFPLIGNQLLARGDPRQAKAEANRVVIEGAEIQLRQPGGGEVSPAYSVVANGTVDPTTTGDPAYGVTQVTLIPGSQGAILRGQLATGAVPTEILAELRIFGHTLGGKDVETGIYVFPIRICIGCLVTFAEGGAGCRNLLSGSTGATTRSTCSIGQDYPTDCRTCRGVRPYCTPCATDADCTGMSNTAGTGPSTCNASTNICN